MHRMGSSRFGTVWSRRLRSAAIVILLGFLMFSAGACAMKAPPVARDTVVPKRIVDLEALPREGRLLLAWTVPKESTNNRALIDLEKFQIQRSEGTLIGDQCRGCGGVAKVVHEMRADSEMRGKKVSLIIEDQESRKVYVYEVIPFTEKGYAGSASNPVTVFWDYPPSIPARVRGERGDRRVLLSWALGPTGVSRRCAWHTRISNSFAAGSSHPWVRFSRGCGKLLPTAQVRPWVDRSNTSMHS